MATNFRSSLLWTHSKDGVWWNFTWFHCQFFLLLNFYKCILIPNTRLASHQIEMNILVTWSLCASQYVVIYMFSMSYPMRLVLTLEMTKKCWRNDSNTVVCYMNPNLENLHDHKWFVQNPDITSLLLHARFPVHQSSLPIARITSTCCGSLPHVPLYIKLGICPSLKFCRN